MGLEIPKNNTPEEQGYLLDSITKALEMARELMQKIGGEDGLKKTIRAMLPEEIEAIEEKIKSKTEGAKNVATLGVLAVFSAILAYYGAEILNDNVEFSESAKDIVTGALVLISSAGVTALLYALVEILSAIKDKKDLKKLKE